VADLTPKIAERLAKCVRMLHNDNLHQRRAAFAALERALQSYGADFRDLGNWIEQPGNGKFSEAEMQEIFDAARKEGVEAGIKLGLARATNGGGNNHSTSTLPTAAVMTAYCYERRDRLNDWERNFIDDMHVGGKARWLTPKRKSKLQDIYQLLGGT
jgi:hypothetical protein